MKYSQLVLIFYSNKNLMNICILHIGTSATPPKKIYPSSPIRFYNLLAPYLPNAKWSTVHCLDETIPKKANEFDAYLITGGKYSVFDNFEWQDNLFELIQKINLTNIPLLGVCYGHQAIAYALGGKVERHIGGWGAGITSVNIKANSKWLKPRVKKINLYAMHQDQVTRLPSNATQFLSNSFCKISGFYIEDHILTIQQHPEFNEALCRDLIISRKDRIGPFFDSAIQSLETPSQGSIVGEWMANFINLHSNR